MCKLGSQSPVNFESPQQQGHTALYRPGMALECRDGRRVEKEERSDREYVTFKIDVTLFCI